MMARGIMAFALVCIAALAGGEPGREEWEEGRRFYWIEDYKRAQKAFERAVSRNPDSSTYNLWLGAAIGRRAEGMTGFGRFRAMGLARKVKVQFERAVELDGSNLAALEALQLFHFDAPGIVGGNKSETRKLADRIKRLDPTRGAIAWALCFEEGKDFADADAQHALARQLAPDNTAYLAKHAAFLSRRGRQAESDELFNTAFARDPDNRLLMVDCGQSVDRRQAFLAVSESVAAAGTLSRECQIGTQPRHAVPGPQAAEKAVRADRSPTVTAAAQSRFRQKLSYILVALPSFDPAGSVLHLRRVGLPPLSLGAVLHPKNSFLNSLINSLRNPRVVNRWVRLSTDPGNPHLNSFPARRLSNSVLTGPLSRFRLTRNPSSAQDGLETTGRTGGEITIRMEKRWCERGDSNPHGRFAHQILNLARLPIPPLSHPTSRSCQDPQPPSYLMIVVHPDGLQKEAAVGPGRLRKKPVAAACAGGPSGPVSLLPTWV